MTEEEIKQNFKSKYEYVNFHYLKRYIRLTSTNWDLEKGFEKHHILPKSLFPEFAKEKTNLVKLPYRVHLLAHLLLAKMLPNSAEMNFAFYKMCNLSKMSNHYTKYYEVSKIQARRYLSEKTKFRVSNGTHNFLGDSNPARIASKNGKHLWSREDSPSRRDAKNGKKSIWAKAYTKKLLDAGTHPFQGKNNPCHERVRLGIHQFQGDRNPMRVASKNGTHHYKNIEPWNSFSATDNSLLVWSLADKAYDLYVENTNIGHAEFLRKLQTISKRENLSFRSTKNLLAKLKSGWTTLTDPSWIEFRDSRNKEKNK